MFKITFSELGSVDESEYSRVVMVARLNGKWIFCKHKQRDTWEIPGGHVEEGEDWLTTAKRELFEETGAVHANIKPICVYTISKPGLLCFAEIEKLGKIPDSEIEKIEFFDDSPENLTYPDTHKLMFEKAKEFLKTNKKDKQA